MPADDVIANQKISSFFAFFEKVTCASVQKLAPKVLQNCFGLGGVASVRKIFCFSEDSENGKKLLLQQPKNWDPIQHIPK